jgi:hypothetical protein
MPARLTALFLVCLALFLFTGAKILLYAMLLAAIMLLIF